MLSNVNVVRFADVPAKFPAVITELAVKEVSAVDVNVIVPCNERRVEELKEVNAGGIVIPFCMASNDGILNVVNAVKVGIHSALK